jgi:hypothetical protein
MILKNGHSTQYLLDYKDGKISQGLGIGCVLDDYLRFKTKQLNIVLGHDNVGKSYFMLWYFLALAVNHNLKFVLWMGENSSGQVMRDLIQMYSGRKFNELTKHEILAYQNELEQNFQFISNEQMYTPQEILKLIESTDANVGFIDPFTGLNRGMQHSDNYEFLNYTRDFCNRTGKTLYISTHPNSESGRSSMLYPQDHHWFGHLKPPLKAHIEGGKPFLNRCDDMIVIHRLVKHAEMKYMTMIEVEKIKDRDTGGQQTELNTPLLFDYNYGLGFKIGGVDPIKRINNDLPF